MQGQGHRGRPERLVTLLAGLGYGSRREVEHLIRVGRVTDAAGRRHARGDVRVVPEEVRVDGAPLDPSPGMVLALHKPVGFACSTAVAEGALIYDLLPPRFRARRPALSSIGRLDRDTSGLLLMTDDGSFLHRVISPRHAVEKCYEATLDRPLQGEEAALFASGTLLLRGEDRPCAPARLWPLGPHGARLALTEGRYHQVRRMFAAVGNHVTALRRIAIGGLALDPDTLPEGAWRLLSPGESEAVFDPLPDLSAP